MSKYYKPNNSTIMYLNSSYNCVKSSSITLTKTSGGTGYTSAPTITITPASGDTGAGAVATCTVSGGAISAVSMTTNGANYTALPTITLTGGGSPGVITGVSSLVGGAGYTSSPVITATGGGGTGFSGVGVLATTGLSSTYTITTAGSGYIVGDKLIFSGGGGTGTVATVSSINGSGGITGITQTTAGTGYTSLPSITVGGSGAVITTALTADGKVSSTFSILTAGSGYIVGDAITFISGGGGTSAVATVGTIDGNGGITGLSLTNAGSGYTNPPNIIIGGTGAVITQTALPARAVASVSITNGGSGYTSAPTLVFTGGGYTTTASASPTVNVGTPAVLTPSFARTYNYSWKVPDIVINDLAKLSAINIVATGFTNSTPYTYRINGLQYDSRDSFFSDFGSPILSIAQNVNVCSYGSLGGTNFSIILTQQPINQINISVDDDITSKGSGQLSSINFIIALEIEEYDPVLTQIGDPYGESYNRMIKNVSIK